MIVLAVKCLSCKQLCVICCGSGLLKCLILRRRGFTRLHTCLKKCTAEDQHTRAIILKRQYIGGRLDHSTGMYVTTNPPGGWGLIKGSQAKV